MPVEADGSAYFEVPAGRQLFFVALDENDLSVKRMQSFVSVMPGEVQSCVGCHEQRTQTPDFRRPEACWRSTVRPARSSRSPTSPTCSTSPATSSRSSTATASPATTPRSGKAASSSRATWAHLVAQLLQPAGPPASGRRPQRPGQPAAAHHRQLRQPALGRSSNAATTTSRSRREEWRTVWLWIESGAPYAGTYAALRNQERQNDEGRAFGRILASGGAVLRNRCFSCHNPKASDGAMPIPYNQEERREALRQSLDYPTGVHERLVTENDPVARFSSQILVNLTRPELSSILLGPLAREAGGYGSCGPIFQSKDDPDYKTLLAALQQGQVAADEVPRYGTPGFLPNSQYIREMKRFGVLPAAFELGATRSTSSKPISATGSRSGGSQASPTGRRRLDG